jgi:hypothetical protein
MVSYGMCFVSLGAGIKAREALINYILSVSACINSAPTGQIYLKFGIRDLYFEKLRTWLLDKNAGSFIRRTKYILYGWQQHT